MIRVDWLITGLNITGGAEIYTRRITPCLQRKDIDIRVITLRSSGQLVNQLSELGIPVIELGAKNKLNPAPIINLLKYWQKTKPDIVHTHLYHAGIIGRLVGKLCGIKHIVVHQHGAEKHRSRLRSILDRLTTGMVDRYLVTCKAVGEILAQREHISPSKITVIYNGIEPFSSFESEFPDGWPAEPGNLVIGCVGRLVREKNHPILLQALQRLTLKMIDFHAIMIGEGPERFYLEKLCTDFGLSKHVSWVGEKRDLHLWLQHMDIFVLPSNWEGLSLSILEAMAAKKPVVATAVGGTPEVVLSGTTGILIPPNDVDALYKAIYTLIYDPDLRNSMGDAGWQRVTASFTMSSTVSQLSDLYTSLVLDQQAK